jgi:hypothetical protein
MTEQKKARRARRQQLIRIIRAESETPISKGLAKRWAIYQLAHPK